MIYNYVKTAWRNLTRNKGFSFINIVGLALGLTCGLMILLWVNDERSVDKFHVNGKRLYQVYERWFFDGKVDAGYATQGLLPEELKKLIPDIEHSSGFEYAAQPGTQNNFSLDEKTVKMNGMFAGVDFLRMFTFPLLQGDKNSSISKPGSIAISRKMAAYFFNDPAAALGKIIRFENREDLLVTAVFENIPANSSLQFDFLRCWEDFKKQNDWINNWGNTSPSTFIQVKAGSDIAKVRGKVKDFVSRYRPGAGGVKIELELQPFSERYLYSRFKNGFVDGGRIEYVKLFTIVAIVVLLIACINFMNLSTARAVNRAKEVGLRKVIGAARYLLIMQFMGEALVLAFFAMCLAVAMVLLLLPMFNHITGKQLVIPFADTSFIGSTISILLVTALVAGSYPALFLSSLHPIRSLKGSLKFGSGSIFFRKALVVFQFALSMILITAMIVVYRQVEYIQSKNLGYDRDNLIYVPIEGELVKNYSVFKQKALSIPGIENISKMRNSPTVIEHHTGSIEWAGKPSEQTVSFADGVVGYDFVNTMKLTLVEGRDFSKDFGTDSAGYLLNETAASRIGFKNPVGETVAWGNRPGKIIGVLKDFHFASMQQSIDPLIIRLDENWGWGTILVRARAGKTKSVIAGLEQLCKSLNPKIPFSFQFSDAAFANLYRSEQTVSKLSGYFSLLAILISCLGLFGLVTFAASQRTREIGIRKVLGASTASISQLLSKDFLRLILLAIVIAAPIAWWVMSMWLDNYVYRVPMNGWTIATAALIASLIAAATIASQAVKAAIANPVKSLRSE